MKVKKYLSLLLAVVMIASVFSTTAFASESELPVNEVIIGGDSLEYRAPNPPTLFYNLGGSGQYTATLIDLAANRGSYTKYYFATSTGEIYLKFDLERSGTTTNKNRELIGNGIALTLLVIVFAEVITAQSFVQSCDFLVFSHNLRSFLRF